MDRRTRIEAKVKARVTEVPGPLDTSCWLWTGPDSGGGRGGGYPRMALDGQTVAVHIVMWTNAFGFVPGKKQLDHLCRNRRCVNPAHLELVTHKLNQKRRAVAQRELREVAG